MQKITISNPAREFLREGIYMAESAKMCIQIEMCRLPDWATNHSTSQYFGFRAAGKSNNRFLRPIDPLFWMSSDDKIEIEVEQLSQ